MPGITESDDRDRLRNAAQSALRGHIKAADLHRAQLVENEDVTGRLLDAVFRKVPVLDALQSNDSGEVRVSMSTAIRKFERARHDARVRLISLAIDEGASDQDILRTWNFNREMLRRSKIEIAALEESSLSEPDRT